MSYNLVNQLYLQPLFVCMWTLLKDLWDLEAPLVTKKVLGGMNSHFSGDASVHRAGEGWKVSAGAGGLSTILLGQRHKIYPPVLLPDDKASPGQHNICLFWCPSQDHWFLSGDRGCLTQRPHCWLLLDLILVLLPSNCPISCPSAHLQTLIVK